MNKSQFEAGTFGVGELITQRKLFRVPQHQRSYAWDRDAVGTFLSDVESAFNNNASEYFIGLVVIQGPEDGEWILLDGQQRLTTSTMLFAAIRNWLTQNSMSDDARQIETEFLGVRRLGGDYSSRMQLNEDNQNTFKLAVIEPTSSTNLKRIQQELPKKASNRLLVDAALECQNWIESMSNLATGTIRDRAERLFRLSSFLESRVKVVCVEISNDVDPYILFESLNDRGVELSALDLLKNYVYSKSTLSNSKQFDLYWDRLVVQLDNRNPDDFLKVSWTATHGIVQKTLLFRNIRRSYRTQGEVLNLLELLAKDARILAALDDPEDPIWGNYSPRVKDYIFTLNMLGGRQSRPVALAAISSLPYGEAETLIWYLIVVIVRYQIIGRGRTGVMEKVFGRFCVEISSGRANTPTQFQESLAELWVSDADFSLAFAGHKDSKLGRFAYFLAQLELRLQPALASVQQILARTTLAELVTPRDRNEPDIRSVGEFALLEFQHVNPSAPTNGSHSVSASSMTITVNSIRFFEAHEDLNAAVSDRSSDLASLAPTTWAYEP